MVMVMISVRVSVRVLVMLRVSRHEGSILLFDL